MKKIILALLCATGLLFASCGSIMKGLSGFKDPIVQNVSESSKYFEAIVPNEKTYFLSVEKVGDSASIFDSFFTGFSSDMKIFSKNGQKYCYNGTEECSGVQMSSAFSNFTEKYQPCTTETNENLETMLGKLMDKDGKKVQINDFPDSDYYIFQNWDTYSSSKKNLKQDIAWLTSLRNNATINAKVIFVNGDLLEEWGLKKNEKLKTKFKKNGKGLDFTIKFGKLPLK